MWCSHVYFITRVVIECVWIHIRGNNVRKIYTSQKQYIAQRVNPFVFQKILYKFGQNNKFHPSSATKQVSIILQELHGRVVGGHLSSDITMRKILDVGY
jgi:hypothetical protein